MTSGSEEGGRQEVRLEGGRVDLVCEQDAALDVGCLAPDRLFPPGEGALATVGVPDEEDDLWFAHRIPPFGGW